MTRLTKTGHIRRFWSIIILLESLIFLTGATWYFTPKQESLPASQLPFISKNPIVKANDDASQTTIDAKEAFAPFLDIVPGEDGTDLFISASNAEVGGSVVANISIGGGNHKGGTMTYSDTVKSYITTVSGFSPQQGQAGNMFITSTLGLDTGGADFERAYVPPSTTQIINSTDGNLTLSVVSTDTFPSEAYVAVVPSYAPPGPAPSGHQLVGTTYSARASGAIVVTDRPMTLRLAYNPTSLAGADPHTLAIFAWDPFNKRWDDLGGTLFSDLQFVSVATSRFTAYALMTTTTWRDEFFDITGLEFAQADNITLGGTPENRTLVLADTSTPPSSGTITSQPLTPTTTLDRWGTLTFSRTITPPTTTLSVDVLSLDGTPILTDVASGTDLSQLIDPTQDPSLRLRVTVASTATG